MLETAKYERKPFVVDAIRVTVDNIKSVAEWTGGEVRTESRSNKETVQYVKVRVHRPIDDRQSKAYIGDWVLYAGTGFKVYTLRAFNSSFSPANPSVTPAPGVYSETQVTSS